MISTVEASLRRLDYCFVRKQKNLLLFYDEVNGSRGWFVTFGVLLLPERIILELRLRMANHWLFLTSECNLVLEEFSAPEYWLFLLLSICHTVKVWSWNLLKLFPKKVKEHLLIRYLQLVVPVNLVWNTIFKNLIWKAVEHLDAEWWSSTRLQQQILSESATVSIFAVPNALQLQILLTLVFDEDTRNSAKIH